MAEALISRGGASSGGGGGCWECLATQTGDGVSRSLTVDMSSIDLTSYAEIKLIFTGGAASSDYALTLFVNETPSGATSNATVNLGSSVGGVATYIKADLHFIEDTGYLHYEYVGCLVKTGSTSAANTSNKAMKAGVYPADVTSFNFGTYNNGWKAVPSSLRVTIYGLKKGA